MKPRLLDLFCGAGGAAMGYHRAGFDVVGVDINPQPNYPFEFHQADAMTHLYWLGRMAELRGEAPPFDAIHASPPCQAYGSMANLNRARGRECRHPKLIEAVRDRLIETGLPYVIENTERAPLLNPIKLCGSSFGLRVRRHRLFESTTALFSLPCTHVGAHTAWDYVGVYGVRPGGGMTNMSDGYKRTRRAASIDEGRAAMGIDWMEWRELCEAIPPAYTEFIGAQLLSSIEVAA